MPPAVTVAVPTFDRAATLRRASSPLAPGAGEAPATALWLIERATLGLAVGRE